MSADFEKEGFTRVWKVYPLKTSQQLLKFALSARAGMGSHLTSGITAPLYLYQPLQQLTEHSSCNTRLH